MPSRTIPGFVPRPPRAAVDLPATITSPRGEPIEAHLCNLSLGGFFALCSAPIAIGSRITVAAAELGPLQAQVRWALGARIGALFEDELSDEARAAIAVLLGAHAGDSDLKEAIRLEPA